jgi:hypothetical protein
MFGETMRHFGVDEANRLVPVLTRTFETVRPWVARAQELTQSIEDAEGKEIEAAQTENLRAERSTLVERIREELVKLEEMGLEIKAADGLVDFRALLGGRQVYLCWKYPETAVTHWHELDAGFTGRQAIKRTSDFAPSYLS